MGSEEIISKAIYSLAEQMGEIATAINRRTDSIEKKDWNNPVHPVQPIEIINQNPEEQ